MNGNGIKAWIAGHHGQAAAAGGAVVVVGFALYQRRKAAAANGTSSSGLSGLLGTDTTGASTGTSSGVGIAGLTGAPDTSLTDMQNTLQDQLNTALGQFQSNVNSQISAIPAGPRGPAGPAGPAGKAPTPPAPAPRPKAPAPTPRRTPTPPKPQPAAATHQNYTVRPGDTLTAIARRFRISLPLLESRNKQIRNPNLIFPGQTVHIK